MGTPVFYIYKGVLPIGQDVTSLIPPNAAFVGVDEDTNVFFFNSDGTPRYLLDSANNQAVAGAKTFTSTITPTTTDGAALGSATVMWADLFLATGAVINFNNGSATITHSATGPTLSVGAARLDLAFASASQTDGSVLRMGTSGTPLVDDQAGAGFVVGYFDCGATSGWPAGLYINTNVTGVGGSFTAPQGDAVVSVSKATVTGIESFFQFATAGKVTGAARACQATIDFGSYDFGSGGVYSAACFNIKGEGGSADIGTTQRVSCLELKTEGTFSSGSNEDFQTKTAGYAIYINGFTAATGVTNILSSTSLAELPSGTVGLRVGVGADGDAGTAYYIPLVIATEWN